MKTISGKKNIDAYFKQIGERKKMEVRTLLEQSSPHNLPLRTIKKPSLTWKGKVSSKQIVLSIFLDKDFIKTVTKTDKDYMLQIDFVKEGKSLILSNYFRGDEQKDWRGSFVDMNDNEIVLTSLLLNASEGKGPFYFIDELTKLCASDNGYSAFFRAID